MIDKIKKILGNPLALIPMLGSILVIISLLTPFALSRGLEGISISSQSNVWYWGIYQDQDQILSLRIPFMLHVILSEIILFFAISIFILSIEFGLDNLKRKFFGELLFIFSVFIFCSMNLTIKLIEYAFSLMPDLEPVMLTHAPFWSFRLYGFGLFGLIFAICLFILGSIISLIKSRKSFFYAEIIILLFFLIYQLTIGMFF